MISTPRGGVMLQIGGFRFSQQKNAATHGKVRWQCSVRARTKCTAFVTTYARDIIKANLNHSH